MGEHEPRPPIMEQLALTPEEIRQVYVELLGDKHLPQNQPKSDGWCECWAIEREKGNNPSAAFNVRTGYYNDRGQGPKGRSLIDMLIDFGGKADAREAILFLKMQFRPHLLTGFSKPEEKKAPATNGSIAIGSESSGGGKLPQPQVNGTSGNLAHLYPADRRTVSPLSHVTLNGQISEANVRGLIEKNPGITFEGLKLAGAEWAIHPRGDVDRHGCIVLRGVDSNFDFDNPKCIVVQRGDGGMLPPPKGGKEPLKRKNYGPSGFVGRHGLERIKDGTAQVVWKVEGVSDLIALQGIIPPEMRDTNVVISSTCGAGERGGPKEFAPCLAGKHVVVAGDCDKAGQEGVDYWISLLRAAGAASIQILPPWTEVKDKKGDDLRDLIAQGKTYDDLFGMLQEESLEVVEEEPEDDGEFRIVSIGSRELIESDFTIEWHAPEFIAKGQNLVFAGASKTLKTSIMLDIAVSVATGTDALNQFPTHAGRIGIITGESGPATIKDTVIRICDNRGIDPREPAIQYSFQVPQLSNEKHLTAVRKWIERHQFDMVVLDPAYLMLLDSSNANSSGNVFSMGVTLRNISRIATDTGITPQLLHHATKSAARLSIERSEPLGLEDMSQSGFAEFARQWVLISRRSKWDGTGHHALWMNYGGSAGHGGVKGVDVREGLRTDQWGRKWAVTVRDRHEVEEERVQEQQDHADEILDERRLVKLEKAKGAVLAFVGKNGPTTKRDLRRITSVARPAAEDAFACLIDDDQLVEVQVPKGNGQLYSAWDLKSKSTGQVTGQTSA